MSADDRAASPYKVPLSALDEVHVPLDEQVEEHDVTTPVPDAKAPETRDREMFLRISGGA